MFNVMENIRTIFLSMISIGSIEILSYFSDINIILFTVIQTLIGLLTIVYLLYKIKNVINENKKFNSGGANDSRDPDNHLFISKYKKTQKK